MVLLQGILWKWTNYYYGWQPRWFILNDGILSYYKSEEEVNQGCKGSVSLAACNINVHSTDNLRIDIVIPGEKYIYVKAGSTTERTQWLLALKALGKQESSTTTKTRKTSSSGDSNGIVSSDELKTKKSELRLYCDLLVQQVHSIKQAATEENGPNVEKLDENTSLLTATCETFIKTLDECTKITNNLSASNSTLYHLNPPLVPQNPNSTSRNGTSKANRQVFHSNSTSN